MPFTDVFREAAQLVTGNPVASAAVGFLGGIALNTIRKGVSVTIDGVLTNWSLKARGLKKAYDNAAALQDNQKPIWAVSEAFQSNADLQYIFVELADRAILAKRGEEPIILDFTKTEYDLTDAVIYSLVKEKLGKDAPEDIFKFAKESRGKIVDEIIKQVHQDDIDIRRIKEHALMRCSWSRQSNHDRKARLNTAAAFGALLKTLSLDPNKSGIKPPSNISEKGTYALRWKQEKEGGERHQQTAILIKPRTDTEKEIHIDLFDTRRSDLDKDGNPVDGKQGIDNYRSVKEKQIEQDREDIENRRAISHALGMLSIHRYGL